MDVLARRRGRVPACRLGLRPGLQSPAMRVEIAHWPNPVLLRGTQPVERVDDELRKTVDEMARLMVDLRGVGLAAPQVSIPKRFMLVCPTAELGEEQVVINPEI